MILSFSTYGAVYKFSQNLNFELLHCQKAIRVKSWYLMTLPQGSKSVNQYFKIKFVLERVFKSLEAAGKKAISVKDALLQCGMGNSNVSLFSKFHTGIY